MTDSTDIQQISVLGAGTMGAGIAQYCLQAGYCVTLFDVSEAVLGKAKASIQNGLEKACEKQKITLSEKERAFQSLVLNNELATAVQNSDLIIEAVPEDLLLKQSLFQDVYKSCLKKGAVFTSNTSSISITSIGKDCAVIGNFAGLHFFNPAPLMPLVEIIQSETTSESTIQLLTRFVQSLGKTPVLAKDTPGFIVNRVARPFYGEALKILGEYGEAPELIESIDTILKKSGQFKMGPFELMDLIGIDVNFAVTQSVYNAYFQEPRYQPHRIQQAKVNAGHLGRKSKKGFYDYA